MTTIAETTAAEMIANELESICAVADLERFAADQLDPSGGNSELRVHESLVRTRLGGDYDASAWEGAMALLVERYGASPEDRIRGICAEVAALVRDDGTGDLRVIVEQAIEDDPGVTAKGIAEIVREARADAARERERENA